MKIAVMNGYAEQNLKHKPDFSGRGNVRGNPEAEFVLKSTSCVTAHCRRCCSRT